MAARRRKRRSRSSVVLRWLGLGALVLVGLLYYKPLRTYFSTRSTLAERAAEVHALRVERRRLQRKLALSTSDEALAREARRLGFVRPGERLFIVKGVRGWLKREARRRATIARDGG